MKINFPPSVISPFFDNCVTIKRINNVARFFAPFLTTLLTLDLFFFFFLSGFWGLTRVTETPYFKSVFGQNCPKPTKIRKGENGKAFHCCLLTWFTLRFAAKHASLLVLQTHQNPYSYSALIGNTRKTEERRYWRVVFLSMPFLQH